MQTAIAAGDFKTKCLKLLDQVAETREPLVITKHGKAVARVSAIPARRSQGAPRAARTAGANEEAKPSEPLPRKRCGTDGWRSPHTSLRTRSVTAWAHEVSQISGMAGWWMMER